MTTIQTAVQRDQKTPASAPQVSLSRERLHFVTFRKGGARQSPRLRLTGSLVGRR